MSSAVEEGHLEIRMEETASSPVPNIYTNSSSGLHAAPPEVSRQERQPLMKGKGWAGGKTATPRASSSTPHQAFSAKSSDSSPPLPGFTQSVSSAMTGSGSGSVSTNNHENGTAAADAAGGGGGVMGREGAAAGGLGHAAFKGEGTEESREEEVDERGRPTKDGRGLLLGRRGRGDKEKQEKNSKGRQRRGIFSESNSTKNIRIVPAGTRKEGAILKESRDVNAAAGAVEREGVHITEEETHGGNMKENGEGSRSKRDLHTSADGREGKARWASIFRDSLEGLMKRGEKTRESAALLNSGEVEYGALNSARAEERTTARGAARGFEGSHRGRGSRGNNTGEGNTTTATVPALSSDVERGRCVMDLEEKEQTARHWIIGSLLVYLALGILVLYCISYANIEWCCIFVVFGGAVAAVGLCGLRQASRVTLLVHAAAAGALLFTLFVAWCYNVYVLLRAVEILMASSWPPLHQNQFHNYYSIPTTYTSPPARWIEEVLRMRLSYPSEDNAAIEMLIRSPPRPTGDGSYLSRKRRPKKRQATPWHRKQESDDLLLHDSADSANEKAAAPLTEEGIGGVQAKEDIPEGDTLPESAAEGVGGRGKRGQAAGAAAAVAAAAGGGGRATQSRQDTQQSGNQTPRKLDAAPSVATTSIEGEKSKEARRLRNDGLRHHDASANAHTRRRLAAEENHTQGRRDGKGETQEGSGETIEITRNKEMVPSGGGDSMEQQSRQVQLVTEDAGGKQQHIFLSSAEEEEVVAGGPAAEATDTTEADEILEKTHPAAAEKKEERNKESRGATRDWKEIWRQERSSGGLRRRLGDTTPGGRTAATATDAQGAPGALGTSPAAGTVRETRRHARKREEIGRRRHKPSPLRVSSAANRDSPPKDAAPPTPRAPEPAAAGSAASRPSPARLATESATAGDSATSAAANVPPAAGDRHPTSPSSAAETTAAQADTGKDKPLAGQLRGSGSGVEEKGGETVPSGSDDEDKGNAAAAAMWLSLTAAEAEEARAEAAAVAAAANDEDQGWQLFSRRQRSTMERSAAERRLIHGCVEKADKNPLYVTEAAHAMSSLATRGWLCAFARADVLPFHRWPVDCNTECGYEFLHAGHDLQTSNYYDMTRIAEYLIQISSLSAKRMQQCVDYAASTICSIKNRNFIVVWVVLLLLWLLFGCVACCGILPFSLYKTVLVIKGMQQQQQSQA